MEKEELKRQENLYIDMSYSRPHPGEILREEVIAPLGLSLSEAAAKFGVSSRSLEEVVSGKGGIPLELAKGLERSGFSTARFWMVLQAEYDSHP